MDTLKTKIQSLTDHTALWRVVLLCSLVAIVYLATTSSPYPIPASASDKINHILAFAYLTVIARLAQSGLSGFQLLCALTAFGVGIEVTQAFLPHRDFSLADIAADAVGCAIGLLPWPRSLVFARNSDARDRQTNTH